MPPKNKHHSREVEFRERGEYIAGKQRETSKDEGYINNNRSVMMTGPEREERCKTTLLTAFQNFFTRNCTLNEETGDKALLEEKYPDVLNAMANKAVGSGEEGSIMTHRYQYQCFLLPVVSTPSNDYIGRLPIGYHLFRVNYPIQQIFVIISHVFDPSIRKEIINLSEKSPEDNIEALLNALQWPLEDSPSKKITLDKKLERWITSFSTQNNTEIRINDIFWTTETSKKFSGFLSREVDKERLLEGHIRKPFSTENGWWANAAAFFGNTCAQFYHLGKPPMKFRHDTVINQTPEERANGKRNNEIVPIICAIASQFIDENFKEIDEQVKSNYNRRGI